MTSSETMLTHDVKNKEKSSYLKHAPMSRHSLTRYDVKLMHDVKMFLFKARPDVQIHLKHVMTSSETMLMHDVKMSQKRKVRIISTP